MVAMIKSSVTAPGVHVSGARVPRGRVALKAQGGSGSYSGSGSSGDRTTASGSGAPKGPSGPQPSSYESSGASYSAQSSYSSVSESVNSYVYSVDDVTPDREAGTQRLERYMSRSFFDALALGPRAALGLLADAAEAPNRVTSVLRSLSELASDPRPVTEKPAAAADSVAAALLDVVQVGEEREKELLAAVVAGLPEDVKSRLPQDVLEQVQQQSNYYTDVQVVPEGGAEQTAGAMMLGGTPVQSADGATSEVLALQSAVATLSGDLQALAKNTEPGREPMLKTNARDALRGVERSIEALSPSTKSLQSAPVADAIGEAKALVAEVSELLSK